MQIQMLSQREKIVFETHAGLGLTMKNFKIVDPFVPFIEHRYRRLDMHGMSDGISSILSKISFQLRGYCKFDQNCVQ